MGASPNWQHVAPSQFAAIPADLLALPQWLVWKRVLKDGAPKPTKVPYAARTGLPASTTDSNTWATFEEAAASAAANNAYAGVGFVFTEDDPYVGIDLDNCIDAETGELTAEASSTVAELNSYTERTPSGNGLHIIVKGKLPPGGCKKGNVEMYQSGRYFTMTGDAWPGTNPVVEHRTAELCAIHEQVFGRPKATATVRTNVVPIGRTSDKTDDQVLAALRASTSGAMFVALFAGDWAAQGYPSQSEADLALAGMLATACGGNSAQIDRLFRTSALYREKWDEHRGKHTYGEKTIAKALEGAAEHHEDDPLALGDCADQGAKALALAKFNAKFAVVRAGKNVRILEEHRDISGRVDRVSLLNRADFGLAVKNWDVPGKKRGEPCNWWLSQPGRREYSNIDFNPGNTREGEYNLWQGFRVIGRAGDCSFFWQFVQEVICAGDAENYQYLRRYMAHAIQRPGERPEVGIVSRGGQGTGKNTFVEALGSLVAPHFATVNHLDQVIGRFNAHLMNSLIVHANEALWGGNKNQTGKLKAMITDLTFYVEPKGVDSIQITNFLRFFMSSNEDWAVPIDRDDRRFVVLDLSDCHKQDRNYFAAIHAELNNGGREALMYDLQHEDLTGFHPRDRPRSRFGFDMKVRSADSVTQWLYECLQSGYLVGREAPGGGVSLDSDEEWPASLPKEMIECAYRVWCRRQNERFPMTASQMFKQLIQCLPDMGMSRPGEAKDGKRRRCAIFPQLGSDRLSFEKAMNAEGQIEWGPE